MGVYPEIQNMVCPACGGRVYKASDDLFVCANNPSHQMSWSMLISREEFEAKKNQAEAGEKGPKEEKKGVLSKIDGEKKNQLLVGGLGVIFIVVGIIFTKIMKLNSDITYLLLSFAIIYLVFTLLLAFTDINFRDTQPEGVGG